jgi:hypothetical protein
LTGGDFPRINWLRHDRIYSHGGKGLCQEVAFRFTSLLPDFQSRQAFAFISSEFVTHRLRGHSNQPKQGVNHMRYKVTALKPVEILVKTRRADTHAHPGGHPTRALESYEWIFLNAGQERDGLDLVLGILGSYVPNEPAQVRLDRQTVLLSLKDQLPKTYHGLFELSNSSIPD